MILAWMVCYENEEQESTYIGIRPNARPSGLYEDEEQESVLESDLVTDPAVYERERRRGTFTSPDFFDSRGSVPSPKVTCPKSQFFD